MKIRTSIELAAILDDDKCGERRVHAFLKRNLDIVVGTFATSWNYAKAYSEIEFGSDYRADFLVLCADSGSWTAHVIELKSPTDKPDLMSPCHTSTLPAFSRPQLAVQPEGTDQTLVFPRFL